MNGNAKSAAIAASVFSTALVPKRYDLNDLMSDLGHVEHLLDQAASDLTDEDFGTGESRNHNLDRINAMVWVARDMVERLNALTELHYQQIGLTCAPDGVAA